MPRVSPPPRRGRRPTLWIMLAFVVAVAGLVGYRILQARKTPTVAVSAVRTARAATGTLRRTVRLSGTIAARDFAAIVAPRMQGRGGGGGGMDQMIIIKLAQAGSFAKKGDAVAEFDRQSQLQRIEDQQATVVQAEADIAKKKAELDILRETTLQDLRKAKAEMDKARLDLKTAAVKSEIEAEKLKLAAEETAARYKQLEGQVALLDQSQKADIHTLEIQRDRAKLDKTRAEINAERMLMRAPIEGIVVMQSIFRSGQFVQVQEGDQVWPGTMFMQIVNPASMVLNAVVNQSDSQELRLGETAEIRLDAYPDLVAAGRLVAMAAMANASPFGRGGTTDRYVKQVPVRFSIEARDARIIPDLSGSATVLVAEQKDAVIVPSEAVYTEEGKHFVRVKGPRGTWEPRVVEKGLSNKLQVAVRTGLNAGEEVALGRP